METPDPKSPLPTKEALQMLSRAGKSTTNQYLAFQKIVGGGASAKFNAVRQTNDSSLDAGRQAHGFLPKDKS